MSYYERLIGGFSNSYCLVFDGVDESVVLGTSSLNFERTDSFSISAWIKNTGHTFDAIMGKRESSGNFRGWHFGFRNIDKLSVILESDGGNYLEVECTNTSSFTSWTHCVLTYAGTSAPSGVKIYVNGTSQALTTVNDSPLSATIQNAVNAKIGGAANGWFFTGSINQPSVFSKVLSGAEVTQIYNSGKPFYLPTCSANANLTSWWKMFGGIDAYPTIYDYIGSNTGTMTNMESGDITQDTP